jgi:hypothetical protein
VLAPRPAGGPPNDTADRYVYDLYFRDATAAIPAGTGATLEGFVPDEGELVASDEEEVEEEDLGDEDSNGSWAAIGEDFKSAPLTLSHRRPSCRRGLLPVRPDASRDPTRNDQLELTANLALCSNDYPDEFSSPSEGDESEDEDAHRRQFPFSAPLGGTR